MAWLRTAVLTAVVTAACGNHSPHGSNDAAGADTSTTDAATGDGAMADGIPLDAGASCTAPGVLDPSFGTAGSFQVHLGTYSLASALIIDSAGRIVVAGSSTNPRDGRSLCLAIRLLPDGTPDGAFGANGIAEVGVEDHDCWFEGIAEQPDGKLVGVGGLNDTTAQIMLARLNPDGTLDPTFGVGGFVIGQPGLFGHATGVVLDEAGRIVTSEYDYDGIQPTDPAHFRALRYLADGELDLSFGSAGFAETAFDSGHDLAYDIVRQPDGKLVVAGETEPDHKTEFALARFDEMGHLDPTFGQGGTTTFNTTGTVVGLARGPAGDFAVAGEISTATSICGGAARFSVDGVLDTSFGTSGLEAVCLPAGTTLQAAAADAHGDLLSMGWTNTGGQHIIVGRFGPTGLDISFGNGGVAQLTSAPRETSGDAIAVQDDSHVIVAGSIGDWMTFDVFVARFCQ